MNQGIQVLSFGFLFNEETLLGISPMTGLFKNTDKFERKGTTFWQQWRTLVRSITPTVTFTFQLQDSR